MSEVASALACSVEHEQQQEDSVNLTELINNSFRAVAAAIPSEQYRDMYAGETKRLYSAPGLGQIALTYHGSRYVPKNPSVEHDTTTPQRRYEYTLYLSDDCGDISSETAEPFGWWMRLKMVYGPKLLLDSPATTQELMGSTVEIRRRLGVLLGCLCESYLADTTVSTLE